MNTFHKRLLAGLFIAAWVAIFASLSGCDAAPIGASKLLEAAEPTGVQPSSPCSDELHDIVSEKAEKLTCHAECAELFVSCLEEEAPACWSCEHEAAICRSTCTEPAFWVEV